MDLALIEHADAEIELARVELLQDAHAIDGAKAQRNGGRRRCNARKQARNHRDLDGVGKADSERPLGGRGVEGLALQHRRLDLGKGHAHGIGKRQRPRGRPHPLGAAGEKLVAEQCPEPRQIVAHGRLAEPDASRGARDAALRQQRVKRDQQVQVEPA